jgi:peptide/nickel transport system substrate-binding protein
LRAGNLTLLPLNLQDVPTLKGSSEIVVESNPASGSFYICLGLHQTQGIFGKNVKVRQAALYALNREAMQKTFGFGQGTLTAYPYWTDGMIGYDKTLPAYTTNPDRAKQLLAEAGFAGGVDVTLSVIQRSPDTQQAEAIKQMWDAVGIRTKLDVLERTAWISKLKDGKVFDAAFWQGIYPADPDQNSQFLLTGGASNWGGYSNPQVDKLMADARTTLDQAKRADLYKQVQQAVYSDACIGVAYFAPIFYGYQKALKGVEYDVNTLRVNGAYLDK